MAKRKSAKLPKGFKDRLMPDTQLFLLMDLYSFLKDASSLRNIGYNEARCENMPGKKDETGVTLKEYKRAAAELERRAQRLKKQVMKPIF